MITADTVYISIELLSLEVCRKHDYSQDGLDFFLIRIPESIIAETVFIFYWTPIARRMR